MPGNNTINPFGVPGQIQGLIASVATDLVSAKANALAIQNALKAASQPFNAQIPPTFDNAPAPVTTAGAGTVTITNCRTFGPNRYTFVAITYKNATTPVSGVTFGGVAMTLLQSTPGASMGMDVFGIANASIGTASIPSVVVTNSNAGIAEVIQVLSLMGVSAVSAATVNSGSSAAATNTKASALGHLVVDFMGCINGAVTPANGNIAGPSPLATAPLYATQGQATVGAALQLTSETMVAAVSTAISYTVPNGAWIDIAFDVTGFIYQGSATQPGTVWIPGQAGANVTYYLAMPTGNTWAAIEAFYLYNVYLLLDVGVTLKLANAANCYHLLAYGCRHFTMEGGVIDGNSANCAVGTGQYNDYAGVNWMGVGVWFDNCTDTLVRRFQGNYTLKQALFATFCTRWKSENTYFTGGQSFQIDTGCRDVDIFNIVGDTTQDTLFAVVPMDYPAYNVRGGGNIINIVIKGIHCNSPADEACRFVGGNNVYGTYGAYLSDVGGTLPTNINGVSIVDDLSYVQTTGTIVDGLVIDNVSFTTQFNDNAYPFVCTGTHVGNVTLKNFHHANFAADGNVACFVLSGSIQSLRIEDSDIPVAAAMQGNFVLCNATSTIVNDLTLANCIMNGANTTTPVLVGLATGCSIGTLNLISNMVNGCKAVVELDGTLGFINAIGNRTPGTKWAFNLNTPVVARAVGNDFSGATGVTWRNGTGSGTVAIRGSGNVYSSNTNFGAGPATAQTNMSVSDPGIITDATFLTPVTGDQFYNKNAAYAAGVGFYVMGTVPTRIGA